MFHTSEFPLFPLSLSPLLTHLALFSTSSPHDFVPSVCFALTFSLDKTNYSQRVWNQVVETPPPRNKLAVGGKQRFLVSDRQMEGLQRWVRGKCRKKRVDFDCLKLQRYKRLKIYGLLYWGELLKSILLQAPLVTKWLKRLFNTHMHSSVACQVNMQILIVTLNCREAVYSIKKTYTHAYLYPLLSIMTHKL